MDINFSKMFSWNKPVVEDKKIIPTRKYTTNRQSQNTLKWREAILQAEQPYFPYRDKMIYLYQDTILNSQVIACVDKRKDMTLLRDWCMIKPSGVEDKNAYTLLNKLWFRKFLNYSLDAIYYGYSMIQLGSIVNNEFPNLQISRREFVSPDMNMILDYPSTPSGTDVTLPKYKNWNILIQTINNAGVSTSGYGLFYPVSLLEIYLRNLLGLNADFVELYTQPFRVGKTNKTTEEERDFMQDMLENFGSNGWALMDEEDSIEFLDTKGKGGFDAYADFEKRLEAKISKIILGHADAIDSTPGKLGGVDGIDSAVAMALRDKRNTDAVFIENIVNNELIPRMNALGFNIKSKFTFKSDDEEQAEITYLTDTAVKLAQAGMMIDNEYYTEKTGIPLMQQVSGDTQTNTMNQ